MSETKRRVISLRGPGQVNEDNKAAEAIKPGHLTNIDGSGNLIKNTTTSGDLSKSFALERDEFGSDIDVAYAVNDVVKIGAFAGGDRVLALTPSGQNLAKGARVEADNAGRVVVYSSGSVIGRTIEAVNNSAGPGDARVALEII